MSYEISLGDLKIVVCPADGISLESSNFNDRKFEVYIDKIEAKKLCAAIINAYSGSIYKIENDTSVLDLFNEEDIRQILENDIPDSFY